jgi:hypothetical protein
MDRRAARRLFIGVTDQSWYDFLSAEPGVDEVNFWRPGGGLLNAMQGAPFLFKLKAPLVSPFRKRAPAQQRMAQRLRTVGDAHPNHTNDGTRYCGVTRSRGRIS